jgi:hypothetical protein
MASEQHLTYLNESLDLNLTGAVRERPAGDFSVDLVAEDEDGETHHVRDRNWCKNGNMDRVPRACCRNRLAQYLIQRGVLHGELANDAWPGEGARRSITYCDSTQSNDLLTAFFQK